MLDCFGRFRLVFRRDKPETSSVLLIFASSPFRVQSYEIGFAIPQFLLSHKSCVTLIVGNSISTPYRASSFAETIWLVEVSRFFGSQHASEGEQK
jgi:hypothetical protein